MNSEKLIGKGNTANIYLVENQIQKVFHERFTEAEAIFEANKQMIAYENGLSVPRVLEVTTIDSKPVIIMEYIKGRTLGELLLEDMGKAEYYLSVAADIHLQIHSKETTSVEPMSERLKRHIQAAPCLQFTHKSKLLDQLKLMPKKNNLCHGDFHPFNVIVGETGSTIIDWVDASSGNTCADVFRSYILYSQHSTELADLYVKIYCGKSGILEEEIFAWAPIIAAARISDKVSTENVERLVKIIDDFFKR